MKTIEVTIKGTSPLLQHRFNEETGQDQNDATRTVLVSRGTPREQAESVCYRNPKGGLYFPSTWILGTLTEAGANHKLKGSRKSTKFIVPAAVSVAEIEIPITNGDGKTSVENFEVDSRPVTIPATKGRIMRHRPRFDHWSASFHLRVKETLLPEDFIHRLLDEAGEGTGIGDFRPQRRGPFGCFVVMKWGD